MHKKELYLKRNHHNFAKKEAFVPQRHGDFMKSKNMCKFIESGISESLTVESFVLETEKSIMETPSKLSLHRAVLVLMGEGAFSIDGKEFPFRAGTLCFFFEGETVFAVSKDSCEYMYVTFSGSRADELFRRFGIHTGNRTAEGLDGSIPLWRESLMHASKDTIDLAAESVLLYTFSRLKKNTNEKDGLIQEITSISENTFHDPTLSIVSISEELNYNPKYLSHIFKERTGTSYTEYLRMLRLKYAVSLFEHGIDSIKNVALLSGFSDPLYFSAVFKQTLGVSPKEYLKREEEKKGKTNKNGVST